MIARAINAITVQNGMTRLGWLRLENRPLMLHWDGGSWARGRERRAAPGLSPAPASSIPAWVIPEVKTRRATRTRTQRVPEKLFFSPSENGGQGPGDAPGGCVADGKIQFMGVVSGSSGPVPLCAKRTGGEQADCWPLHNEMLSPVSARQRHRRHRRHQLPPTDLWWCSRNR
jgi:hypothetical protein